MGKYLLSSTLHFILSYISCPSGFSIEPLMIHLSGWPPARFLKHWWLGDWEIANMLGSNRKQPTKKKEEIFYMRVKRVVCIFLYDLMMMIP